MLAIVTVITAIVIILFSAVKLTAEENVVAWKLREKLLIRIASFIPLLFGLTLYYSSLGLNFNSLTMSENRILISFGGILISFLFLGYAFLLARLNYLLVMVTWIFAIMFTLLFIVIFLASLYLVFLPFIFFGITYVWVIREGLNRFR